MITVQTTLSKFGIITTAYYQGYICALIFGKDKSIIQKMFPMHEIQEQDALFDLNMPLKFICGTVFQQRVWQALMTIAPGQTTTYSDIAKQIGKSKAIRAVASACGKNPISWLIPCHRVIPKTGGIGKYRWGTELKQKILLNEGYSI